ncbi:MAG: hypothetical protein V4611_03590 [Patescibacteria group bacterium]
MKHIKILRASKGGFALPTVLIASVVMLMIMALSVTSVVAVRTALKTQYYEQLAKAAGEAGIAYAKACLAQNGNVALWSDAKPLTPSSDCSGDPLLSPQAQVLVAAGGGGGGGWHGGGGGGGGVVSNNSFSVTPQTYTVTVGGGGSAGASGVTGGTGGNSVFGTITANGGGGGGARTGTGTITQANTGGSGGGGAGTLNSTTSLPGPGVNGTANQGNKGGDGSGTTAGGNGGGGGGAGEVGTNASGTTSGAGSSGSGGNGFLSDISGSALYYGAGGSGGRWGSGTVGIAGLTGGGAGGNNTSVGSPGVANTGGGGGGGGTTNAAGGAGGSGVVVVRYPANGSVTATASNTTAVNVGSYKVFRFTASGTFTVSGVATSSCPTDPRCSVMSNDNLRSSFTVGAPTVNSEGRAVAIPNTGYVELIRESTGAVWRTYKQPSVQAAVVPDLCSGQATSALGWGNAVPTTTQQTITGASSAQTISIANSNVAAGQLHFRKDFPVTTSESYTLTARTSSTQDNADVYVDGVLVLSAIGPPSSANVTLVPGCHTISVRLTNEALASAPAGFTLAVQKNGGAPIVATDTSWRVSAGSTAHFSESDYYASPDYWGAVQDDTPAAGIVPNWSTTTGDSFSRFITTPASTGCNAACPTNSTMYYRDNKDIYVPASTSVRLSAACDDSCTVYVDGVLRITNPTWAGIVQQTFTLSAGVHHIAARVANLTGGSGIALTLTNTTTGEVLTRSDNRWIASNMAYATASATDLLSYKTTFKPNPNVIPDVTTFDALVVAGGGGGGANSPGGGGAGGVLALNGLTPSIGTYNVTVGAGAAGATTGSAGGAKGSNSVFGSNTAQGGGGGASRDGGSAAAFGGSGGGGAGATTSLRVPGGAGTANQGSSGGNGVTADAGANATGGGGGGAGGRGVDAVSGGAAGNGGPGYITYMTGSRLAVGGGGGGAITVNGSTGVSTDGGGNGTSMGALNGLANTGGGGGGRTGSAQAGNGGSGVVIVRFITGKLSVTVTGSPTLTTTTMAGVSYTSYTFTNNGTFVITAIN